VLACSGGHLLGSGRITGGHLFSDEDCLVDDGHTSVIACAGATIGHTVVEGITLHCGCWGAPDPALVGAATPGDATVGAATDTVNRSSP
jgi:hypothetical protein